MNRQMLRKLLGLFAALAIILACTPSLAAPTAVAPAEDAIATESLTEAAPTVTLTITPTPLGVTTETFLHDATQIAGFAPGTDTTQVINDRYGTHFYVQPEPPLDEFPDMTQPKSGKTYEVRPTYVNVTLPGCASTMTSGTTCSVWSTGNHAYVYGYANQWQAQADTKDRLILDAGMSLLFERMDATYLYAKTADFGDMFTFVLSEISLTPPASNLTGGDGQLYYWWETPVYAGWGPLDTNLVEINKIYNVFSYGTDHNFTELQVCAEADTFAQQGLPPFPDSDCVWDARDDYLPARILGIVPGAGLWLEYADGVKGFGFQTNTWHFQPGFYQVNSLPYPGGALGQ